MILKELNIKEIKKFILYKEKILYIPKTMIDVL